MTTPSNPPIFAMARARQALRQNGLPSEGELLSISGTRNEVILCGEYVVRINHQHNQRLRREAQVCKALPIRSWTPRVVAHGGELGADFLIVAKRPGMPLSRAWPDMSSQKRRLAISQLAAAMAELHRTPVPSATPKLSATTHLLDATCLVPVMPLTMAVDRLRSAGGIDAMLLNDVDQLILETADSIAEYSEETMIHGDLTFENILWDGNEMTALLDFEWSRGAPADLDLDLIFRYCALPFAHVPAEYADRAETQDYADVPGWLAEDLPQLFSVPRLADRLRIYALAFDVSELAGELPERPLRELDPLHPLRRIADLLSNDGYLKTAFSRVGLAA